MVMDAQNDRLILFGGFQNGVLSNRVLAYSMDEGTWRELTPKGTAPTPAVRRPRLMTRSATG
ncbi:MAG: kelch motif-containing protein [Planctomycetota bacterium]|nr:kelch motif-containing protein [Planctomycetota bacterium]